MSRQQGETELPLESNLRALIETCLGKGASEYFSALFIQEQLLLLPSLLVLIKRSQPKSLPFKLRLLHLCIPYLFACPLMYLWHSYSTSLIAATGLFLMTAALLSINHPLFAAFTMALAINLQLSYLLFLPAFICLAISKIIDNSPRTQIVKQVDYIVWKVIFLLINFASMVLLIYWSLIFKPQTRQIDKAVLKKLLFE